MGTEKDKFPSIAPRRTPELVEAAQKAVARRGKRESVVGEDGRRRMPVGWLNEEGVGWMERRAEAFQNATTKGPGKSDRYGTGEEPKPAPKSIKAGATRSADPDSPRPGDLDCPDHPGGALTRSRTGQFWCAVCGRWALRKERGGG